jgi:ELWxxDGT repeat protein
LFDIGEAIESPDSFPVINGSMYLGVLEGPEYALWQTDGYEITKLANLGDYKPMNFTKAGGQLYFQARRNPSDSQIWTSNGRAEGTEMLLDGLSIVVPDENAPFAVLNGGVCFISIEPATGPKIYKADESGSAVIRQFDFSDGISLPYMLAAKRDTLFISVLSYWPDEAELWASDGTPEGTVSIAAFSGIAGGSLIRDMTPFYRNLYFVSNESLWKYDGHEAAEVAVEGLTNVSGLQKIGDRLMVLSDKAEKGHSVWLYSPSIQMGQP